MATFDLQAVARSISTTLALRGQLVKQLLMVMSENQHMKQSVALLPKP
jgi:hypothetical protein